MSVKILPAAAIFDMDGVLVDSEPLHTESSVRAFDEFGVDLTHEEYRRKITLGDHTVRRLFSEMGGDMDRWHSLGDRKAIMLHELIKEKLALMPGIVRFLDMLKETGIPTALATSAGKRSFELIMEKYDLRQYFQQVVTWEDVKAIKPDPQAYIITAEMLGVRPEECVVFEDTPRGVLAAHRAGMKCVAIPTSTTRDGNFSLASIVVESLEEVNLTMLRTLF